MAFDNLEVQAPTDYTTTFQAAANGYEIPNAAIQQQIKTADLANNPNTSADNFNAKPSGGIDTGRENLAHRADFNSGNQAMMRQENVSILGDCLGQMDKFAVNFAQTVPGITPVNKAEAPKVDEQVVAHDQTPRPEMHLQVEDTKYFKEAQQNYDLANNTGPSMGGGMM